MDSPTDWIFRFSPNNPKFNSWVHFLTYIQLVFFPTFVPFQSLNGVSFIDLDTKLISKVRNVPIPSLKSECSKLMTHGYDMGPTLSPIRFQINSKKCIRRCVGPPIWLIILEHPSTRFHLHRPKSWSKKKDSASWVVGVSGLDSSAVGPTGWKFQITKIPSIPDTSSTQALICILEKKTQKNWRWHSCHDEINQDRW